jgi:mono/diheme cytochrome c family protein
MSTRVLRSLMLASVLAGPAAATTDTTPESIGRALYLKYCGACHGPAGKGDGVAATFFTPKPPDLTQIAKRNHGTFPTMRVMRLIDGRDTLRAHGDPDMPVWGEVFQEQSGWSLNQRAEVQGKIMLITDYLRAIQEH